MQEVVERMKQYQKAALEGKHRYISIDRYSYRYRIVAHPCHPSSIQYQYS